MKSSLQQLVLDALQMLQSRGVLELPDSLAITIERTRDSKHGDFACNAAMVLSKLAKCKPRDLAEQIVDALPSSELVIKTEIAGPGFINFYLAPAAFHAVVRDILDGGAKFGLCNIGNNKKIQIEFVSANPTGPLHVGHGRGAAYGATVANLLRAIGYDVHSEYYVNDAGRQMNILATSVWLRYLELSTGEEPAFPSNAYQGDYVRDIAAKLHRENGDVFAHPAATVFAGLPDDEPDGGDKELYIDALIERALSLLGVEAYRTVFDLGLNYLVNDIRDDLDKFGVHYQEWFSERQLTESGAVDRAIDTLQAAGHVYEDGALWFRSTDFGDEKDRVVRRGNGQTTYFASDIAYHMQKFERGFEQVIDIWGADHHGYVPRVKAALQAMGSTPDKLDVLLVQFAILYRGSERVPMSTRSGSFVTLRQLRKEVGNDAARFFYVMRKCEQHMDFDLELAKSQSTDNPVYYIQYAHARVCSVLRQLDEKALSHDTANGQQQLALLTEPHELALLTSLSRYQEVLASAATQYEPHQLAQYLRDLANDFHTYYNAHQFLVDDTNLRDARLSLISAARQILGNGLELLGVSAPETM
jgi:arginyl-tRNA synthetase